MLAAMWTRREFGKLSVSAMAALAAGKLWAATKPAIGVQLYTVRQQAEKDLPATLKAIHEIGYPEVETYSGIYKNYAAKDLRKLIADNGMTVPSGHFDYNGFEAKFDYANELGVRYMVCPILPQTMWTADGFKQAAAQFNQWAAELQKRGMKFAFHNHNYEFRKYGEKTGYETLLADTDPKLVAFEMDCYWVVQAGGDPVKMLREYPERIRMLHLKDRKPGFPPSQTLDASAAHFTEVGNGTLNWKEILALAKKNKVDYMFVEQDQTDRTPLESLRISYDNLQKLLA